VPVKGIPIPDLRIFNGGMKGEHNSEYFNGNSMVSVTFIRILLWGDFPAPTVKENGWKR
jgi:hypothetical protein